MRFIHVGVGGFGKNWVQRLKANPAVEVVGLVDVSEQALQDACAVGGYDKSICFPNLKAALASVKADALVCSTPPRFHKNDVIAGLRAGLHVISEKPMADNMESCREMLQASAETKRTYVVSQNYRYTPVTWTMSQLVKKGVLGQIGQAQLDFYLGMDFKGGFRHDMEYPLIIDMSIHHFDLIRFITGLDAVSVQGLAWNPKWSNYKGDCSSTLVFEMNNGARILYNGSWCSKGQFDDWNGSWRVEGEKGALTMHRGEIRLYEVPEVYTVKRVEIIQQERPPMEAQAQVLDDFMASIAAGRRPATDAFDNIHSVAMIFAAVEAVRTGRRVTVLDDQTRRLLERP